MFHYGLLNPETNADRQRTRVDDADFCGFLLSFVVLMLAFADFCSLLLTGRFRTTNLAAVSCCLLLIFVVWCCLRAGVSVVIE